MLIPLQAKDAENIVRHGRSLSPGTLMVLPALACRLESAWKFPDHSEPLYGISLKTKLERASSRLQSASFLVIFSGRVAEVSFHTFPVRISCDHKLTM